MNPFFDLNQRILQQDTESIEIREDIYFYQYKDPALSAWDTKEPIEHRYRAYKETPEGYWIVPDYDYHNTTVNTRHKKWIKKQSEFDHTPRKLFAYRNKQNALYSYYRKKLEHLRHLEAKHNQILSIVRKVEAEAGFWGAQRPQIRQIENYLDHYTVRPLKPLERKRPTTEFIGDKDFLL